MLNPSGLVIRAYHYVRNTNLRSLSTFSHSRYSDGECPEVKLENGQDLSQYHYETLSKSSTSTNTGNEGGKAERRILKSLSKRVTKLYVRWILVILLALFLLLETSKFSSIVVRMINSYSEAVPPLLIYDVSGSRSGPGTCDSQTSFLFINNRSMADVVVWPNPASNYKDFAAAEARSSTPWQLNAFWSLESSEYYEQVKDARQLLRKGSEKAFDLEMTYLTTSDIPMPYAYSFINFFKPKIDYEQKRQDKIAAAFISNCSPMNNRKEVLAELIELLPGKIDSFGSCIQNANTTEVLEKLNLLEEGKKLSMWEEKTKIIERYKFTIAFENSNDEDYVTEKYYQALEAGSPPIHLGLTSDQLEKFKPSPNAAINVADFPDVKSLAKRLEEISKNREEYESMLDWKNMPLSGDFGKIVRWGKESEWCRLAKLLRKTWSNPNAFNKQRYENFYLRRKLKPIQSFNLSAPMFHTKPHF